MNYVKQHTTLDKFTCFKSFPFTRLNSSSYYSYSNGHTLSKILISTFNFFELVPVFITFGKFI